MKQKQKNKTEKEIIVMTPFDEFFKSFMKDEDTELKVIIREKKKK